MKKKLFCLLLLLVLPVCLLFTGCDSQLETKTSNTGEDKHLFICIDSFYPDDGYTCHILVHKETRIMYLMQNEGGITLMYDTDGKPMIYKGEL